MIGLKAKVSKDEKIIVFSDIHHPYHDVRKVKRLIEFIKKEQPTMIVNAGDFHDCKEASRFVKDQLAAMMIENGGKTIPDIIEEGVKLADQIADAAPKARKIFVPGNHEVRVAKEYNRIIHLVGKHDPIRHGWSKSRHDWEVAEDFPHGHFVISKNPRIEVWHEGGGGTGQNHAAAAWRKHYARGASVIYGDTHKPLLFLGECDVSPMKRDSRFAIGIGTFANLKNKKGFGYCTEAGRASWAASVAVIKLSKDGNITIDHVSFE